MGDGPQLNPAFVALAFASEPVADVRCVERIPSEVEILYPASFIDHCSIGGVGSRDGGPLRGAGGAVLHDDRISVIRVLPVGVVVAGDVHGQGHISFGGEVGARSHQIEVGRPILQRSGQRHIRARRLEIDIHPRLVLDVPVAHRQHDHVDRPTHELRTLHPAVVNRHRRIARASFPGGTQLVLHRRGGLASDEDLGSEGVVEDVVVEDVIGDPTKGIGRIVPDLRRQPNRFIHKGRDGRIDGVHSCIHRAIGRRVGQFDVGHFQFHRLRLDHQRLYLFLTRRLENGAAQSLTQMDFGILDVRSILRPPLGRPPFRELVVFIGSNFISPYLHHNLIQYGSPIYDACRHPYGSSPCDISCNSSGDGGYP